MDYMLYDILVNGDIKKKLFNFNAQFFLIIQSQLITNFFHAVKIGL
jgi:hypothetical protein